MQYITTTGKLFNEALSFISSHSIIAFDTETSGLNPLQDKVLLMQVGDAEEQFVFNVTKLGSNIFRVLQLLNKDGLTKVMHNAKFDYQFIKTNFDIELNDVECTLLGSKLLDMGRTGLSHSLDSIIKKYSGVILDKELQSSFCDTGNTEFSEEQLQYAALDVKYLIPAYYKISNLLDSRGMNNLSKLEYNCLKVTADMELNGIYIDKKKWLALESKASKYMEELKLELDNYFKDIDKTQLLILKKKSNKNQELLEFNSGNHIVINYDSIPQIKKALELVLNKSIESTSEEYLKTLKNPVVKTLLQYRKMQKLITTYGENFIKQHVYKDNKIHSNFNQLGADSGRYTSSDPNLQQIPREQEYRDPFCAKNDKYKIIAADFSNQELRLLAQLSKDKTFIEGIKQKKDMHCYCASLLYNIPYNNFFDAAGNRIPEMDKKYRTPAKSLVFGLVYGMGPGKLSTQLSIPIKEARDLMDTFFDIFGDIKTCLTAQTDFAEKNKYALSPLDGRRRDLSNVDWDDPGKVSHAYNIAKNFPFQGAGASCTKRALVKINERIKKEKLNVEINLAVHDEIVCTAYAPDAEKIARILETEMISAFNYYAKDIPMEVKAKIGDKWIH